MRLNFYTYSLDLLGVESELGYTFRAAHCLHDSACQFLDNRNPTMQPLGAQPFHLQWAHHT